MVSTGDENVNYKLFFGWLRAGVTKDGWIALFSVTVYDADLFWGYWSVELGWELLILL